ncbi:alpha/beta-hydrolase [Massarina eburnea CBS 473.64]|uniref:Alpha/beta-hydrolase n=1 Tax=Massarina eburnea CBS 473.64 TaxID=1395130 RepID=A0A6A6SFN8_9PLEO|nr:alpha/beta-hydrolase [Massarina eburnea CBS 473.64]
MEYSMHVSSKYLDLTRKKLEVTRLPKEIELGEQRRWELGTPKAVLEPLLDFWLETYDWRTQEAHFNTTLPQYRTTINLPSSSSPSDGLRKADTGQSEPLRIHFVHKRSKHANAMPLLFCHTWPSSFIEVEKIVDGLTDPQSLPSFGVGAQQAFHVVAPSIPGFGFSDASTREDFGVNETADAFNSVMLRLGYESYVAHGTGCICRALALNHSRHCAAVHTVNPAFVEPTLKQSPAAFLKYRLAMLTRARIACLSFGYTPSELESTVEKDETIRSLPYSQGPLGPALSRLYSHRPQTLAYSLCDSPIGLLAGILDVMHARAPSLSPVTSRSRSPFLSPVELEMQHPRESEAKATDYMWTPTEVLNFAMLQWLPGPEASLRWLRRAHLDNTPPLTTSRSSIPLGISSFQERNSHSSASPVMWGSAAWPVRWVKRHQRPASLPAWEAPDLLVLDMRECFGTVLSSSGGNLPTQVTST